MTDARAATSSRRWCGAGVVRPDIDFRKAYTLRFVITRAVGLDLRQRTSAAMAEPAASSQSYSGTSGPR